MDILCKGKELGEMEIKKGREGDGGDMQCPVLGEEGEEA